MLKCRFQVLLICVIVLGVFYISIFAEINSVDDEAMINSLLNSSGVSLKELFFPHSEAGGYYRPLIFLSYELDRILSLADRQFMHLHNIILHLLNVLLVFWLARFLVPPERRAGTRLPIAAALIFGLHPIVTESVNWISGRTDILACNFVLLAVILIMKFREDRSLLTLLAAFVVAGLGILAKETALGILLGVPFLLTAGTGNAGRISAESSFSAPVKRGELITFVFFSSLGIAVAMTLFNFWLILLLGIIYFLVLDYQQLSEKGVFASTQKYLRHVIMAIVSFGLSIGLFILVRKVVFVSNTSRISQTLKLIFQDPNYALSVFLGAFGFYVKKFLFPFPQNFAIREVDPLYALFGVIIFFWCIFLLKRRTMTSALFFCGVFFLFPSFLVAFGTIAWTAYAERYVYVSAAFWSVVACCYAVEKLDEYEIPLRYQVAGTSLLVVGIGLMTLQRNFVWNTNLSLYADTVRKNPIFKPVRNEYMVALAKQKNYSEALRQYYAASSVYTLEYHENIDLNMAQILEAQGKRDEALSLLELCVRRGGHKSVVAHRAVISYLQRQLFRTDDRNKKDELQKNLLLYSEKLYALDGSPMTAYRTGQAAIALKDKKKALHFFTEAHNKFTPDDVYKTYSAKLIAKLKTETP